MTSAIPEMAPIPSGKWGMVLARIAAWVWTVMAGVGGFMLLLQKGPLPLTNGWFAMLSGISACPLSAWVLNKLLGVKISGRVQFAAALAFFIAGRLALAYGRWPIG